jgi:hypothetical protein
MMVRTQLPAPCVREPDRFFTIGMWSNRCRMHAAIDFRTERA